LGYKPDIGFSVERFFVKELRGNPICLHTLSAMFTLLSPFLKGVSARELGIGSEGEVGYVRCPDPGKPYTCGGTVVFELRRRQVESIG